ncbi:MAG: DUF2585 family protein [Candidatus Taylorbacteria bacterium]|nr:DUF2585 family protein [Candidatus Taylorbacteria bacterium]
MNAKRTLYIGVGLVMIQALVLYFLGQPFISASGQIKLWVSAVLSPEMSQQLFDWYTFSHIIHGFIFYGVLRLLFPRMSFGTRLLIAMGIEIGWEIAENTPWVINAYREQALAQGYAGDSILNSVLDTVSMMLGFFFARRAPVWITVALAIIFEVFVGVMIRDNLTLNVLNFIYQFDFIHDWQSGV